MIVYIGILFLVCAWIFIEKKALNRKAIWVPASILIVFATIRDYTVGTDTHTYTKPFRFFSGIEYYILDPEVEYGYQALVYVLLKLGFTEYYVLFFVTSLIVVFARLLFIKRFSPDYLLSVYMFITLSIYTAYFNTLRQGIAISIVMCSLKFLIDKRFWPYCFIIILAGLFHISAIVMIPIYFIVHLKLDVVPKCIGIFSASLMGSSILISILSADSRRYGGYAENAENAGGYLIFIFYIVLGLFAYFFSGNLRKVNKEYNIFEQMYLIGIALVIPILMLGTNPAGPQRVFDYFSFLIIILLPYALKRFNSLALNLSVYMVFFIYFIFTTKKIYEIFPYVLNPLFVVF